MKSFLIVLLLTCWTCGCNGFLALHGCFIIETPGATPVIDDDGSMTAQDCLDACSLTYAAATTSDNGTTGDCFCFSDSAQLTTDNRLANAGCDFACPGGDGETCGNVSGSNWSVYVDAMSGGTLNIENRCTDETLVMNQTVCRAIQSVIVEVANLAVVTTVPLPFAPFSFVVIFKNTATVTDPCLDGSHNCFLDSSDMDAFVCTFDSATGFRDCECPGDNVRWRNDPGTAEYVPGITCVDINECEERSSLCDPVGSNCTNTVGNHACECAFGFTDESDLGTSVAGSDCQLYFDECLVPVEPVCHENANCFNRERYVGCFSDMPGTVLRANSAEMTPELCINECLLYNNAYAYLVPIPSTADCYCGNMLGTEVDVSMCNSPCSGDTSQMCGGFTPVNSVYRTGSGHTCECKEGYSGDGYDACSNIDECMPDPCPTFSDCDDTDGGFTCTCQLGYIELVDGECETPVVKQCQGNEDGDFDRQEAWAADCSVVYLLDCSYAGTDYVGEGERLEVNPGPNAACMSSELVNTLDLDTLDNRDEFVNNQGENFLSASVECTRNSASITIDRTVANNAGFNLTTLFLGGFGSFSSASAYRNDPQCHGQIWYEVGIQYRFVIDGFNSNCGALHTISGDDLTFANAIRGEFGMAGPTISRQTEFKVGFSCTYNSKEDVSRGQVYVYDLRRKRRDVSAGDSITVEGTSAGLEMNLWKDSGFTQEYLPSDELQVSDKLYAQISLQSINPTRFYTQLLRCWQSPSEDSIDKRFKSILSNGCQPDESPIDGNEIIETNDLTKHRIAFPAASFDGGVEDIYIKCLVDVVDTNFYDTTAERCAKLASADQKSFKADGYMSALVVGPVSVIDVCGGKFRGGCEHYCAVSQDKTPVCSCETGFEIDPSDPKKCLPPTGVTVASGGAAPWYSYTIPIVIAVVLVLAAFAVYRARKNSDSHSGMYKFDTPEESSASGGLM